MHVRLSPVTAIGEPFIPTGPAPVKASLPGVKKTVTLRIDRSILERLREDEPGWEERINEALKRAIGE
jgi:uncharacterized protein (DUF4415 family)